MADWKRLPEGYYAVPDPRLGVDEMTYWRRLPNKFGPWPPKSRYGPMLARADLPDGLEPHSEEGQAFVRNWFENVHEPYWRAVVEAIAADPVAAGHRFADFAVRCCSCGKRLTNDLSKVYGIGPECRKGLSEEVLANYFRPEVGRVHATPVD